jgi:hypothetical protein
MTKKSGNGNENKNNRKIKERNKTVHQRNKREQKKNHPLKKSARDRILAMGTKVCRRNKKLSTGTRTKPGMITATGTKSKGTER